jgi:desulfoferrodoxin-like iron-binding protein
METPQVGTRHKCAHCGTEVVVVKAPGGAVACCGETLAPVTGEQK